MNFRISTFLRFFCCLILLTSSINSLDKDDNSGEDESFSQTNKKERSIKDQLNRFSLELRQSKERKDLLKVKVENIDKALNELKWTVDEIEIQVNESDAVYDRRLSQLSDEINNFKEQNEKLKMNVNAINEALRKNGTLENPGNPFIDFHKCKKSLDIAKDEPAFIWTINDLKNKKYEKEFEMKSDIFPLKGYSMKAQVRLSVHRERLYYSLSFKDSNKSSDDVIDVKPLPWVILVFNNQCELGHYNDIITRNSFPHFNETFNYDTEHYSDTLYGEGYDVNGTVVIKIYVETPEQAEQSCSEDGTIAWAIRDVSKKRELEEAHSIGQVSPYFYSGPRGYRMAAAIRLNYYDYHQNRSVLRFESGPISGPYDDDLSTSINMNTTATFFHPTDHTKNIVRSTVVRQPPEKNETNIMIYVTNEELESVLVNDTLYYRITNKFL